MSWWKSQKEAIPPPKEDIKLEVLGSNKPDRAPVRRTWTNLRTRTANQRTLLSPTPVKPPPGMSFAHAVRHGTRETPMRFPMVSTPRATAVPSPTVPTYGSGSTLAAEAMRACRMVRDKKNPREVEQAEELLRAAVSAYHMAKQTNSMCEPVDGSLYNNVIHAYAECNMPQKAESILNLMWHDYKSGNKVT